MLPREGGGELCAERGAGLHSGPLGVSFLNAPVLTRPAPSKQSLTPETPDFGDTDLFGDSDLFALTSKSGY